MASSSDVVKKVVRFKLQLSDTAEPSTVLKILQKLKDLDITLDVLAETGIGKTVNSLRRHEQAGEFAKSLVKGWKRLVPKRSTSSQGEDGVLSENVPVKDKLYDRRGPDNGGLAVGNVNNNCITSPSKNEDSSDEAPFTKRKVDSEKEDCEEWERKMDRNKIHVKSQQENQNIFQNDTMAKKTEIQEDKINDAVSKKKSCPGDRKPGDSDTLLGNKNSEDIHHQKSKSASREKVKSAAESGRFGSEKESHTKSKPSKQLLKEGKKSLSFEYSDKYSKTLKPAQDDRSPEVSRSSDGQKRKREKTGLERQDALKYKPEPENKGRSKHEHKKAKIKHNNKESNGDQEEPSMSFESYLNYDVNVFKRKERAGTKKPPKQIKIVAKEQPTKDADMKTIKSPVTSPKQRFPESLMRLINVPLPAALPECERPSSVEYFERTVEKESDCCDVTEESAVFTGQRLNSKMQVYSGAKTTFLPAMMSLYQQCIRTLQNNINLLYDTGGVPFEILEPVLERCTPEQLLRIEEYNPIYVGVTDHLWGKHCQRDFKDSRLQEYESWKEMYTRLFEERERKLQRLTKTIVSAQSKKPKGRQVKMAFIHTVAKPPRDVRIQQEIHGTAVQQPHQPRCSVKVQDNRSRLSSNEPSRSSTTSSGGTSTQDPRKKTRVAPMMAKSLKAFKKQLGRR